MDEEEKTEKGTVAGQPRRRIFPSALAAFVVGCLIPVVGGNLVQLQNQGVSDLILIPIGVLGLQLPVAVAAFDFTYGRRPGGRRSFSPFRNSWPTRKILVELYIPTWRRLTVTFLGAAFSALTQRFLLS